MSGVGFLIREMHARGLRIYSEPYKGEIPEGVHLLRNHPDGPAGMWWRVECQIGTEEVKKKRKGVYVIETVPTFGTIWEPTARTLVDSIKAMSWVFEAAIFGEIQAPRHEWLCCDVCDESQLLPKGYGATSAKHKCHLTPRCEGTVRRLPQIFTVISPKRQRKPKAIATDVNDDEFGDDEADIEAA